MSEQSRKSALGRPIRSASTKARGGSGLRQMKKPMPVSSGAAVCATGRPALRTFAACEQSDSKGPIKERYRRPRDAIAVPDEKEPPDPAQQPSSSRRLGRFEAVEANASGTISGKASAEASPEIAKSRLLKIAKSLAMFPGGSRAIMSSVCIRMNP